jgi:hypothetical protein
LIPFVTKTQRSFTDQLNELRTKILKNRPEIRFEIILEVKVFNSKNI